MIKTLIITLTIGLLIAILSTSLLKKDTDVGNTPKEEPKMYTRIEYENISTARERTRAVAPLASRGDIISLPLPKDSTGSFKAFERVSSITSESSKQWHLKQIYWIDLDGFARIGEYYVVAIGQFYSNTIGETFIVKLESRTIKIIIGDVKADEDCIDRMYCKINGSIIEFIVSDKMTHEKLQILMSGKILSIVKENT